MPDTDQVAPAAFSWEEVQFEDRCWLRGATEDLENRAVRVVGELVLIGQKLKEIRERLPHGTFQRWLGSHFPWSVRNAYRFIEIGTAFGGYTCQLGKFERTALYVLADPTVPPECRAFALEQAGDGQTITRSLALEIVNAHRERPPALTVGQINEYESHKRTLGMGDKAPRHAVDTGPLGWAALQDLRHSCEVVHISFIVDDETPGRPLISVTSHGEDGPRNCVGYELADLLLELVGRERKKTCIGTKCRGTDPKPLSQFSRNSLETDGHCRYCRQCEVARVRQYKRRKKAGRTQEANQVA